MTIEVDILLKSKTIAVVGLSNDRTRAAYSVSSYMKRVGYTIIPVQPDEDEVLGSKAYPDPASVPVPIDIVNLFKRSEQVPPFVDEAIAVGAKSIWMQQGIANEKAAAKARDAGIEVVQDSCIRTVHQRMMMR